MESDGRDVGTAYAGITALVTGGAGAIGSNLVAALARIGAARVVVLDDLSASREWNLPRVDGLEFVRGSILDPAALQRAFHERPRVVFHLAALFANQQSVDRPELDLQVNALGTLRVLEAARTAGAERFVYASSGCAAQDPDDPLPVREDAVSLRPTTPYQVTKLAGELYAAYFHQHYGLRVAIPRLFNSFGPGEIPGRYRNVIPNFIFRALGGQPLLLTGTGAETRDFTWVGDIVNGLLLAGVRPEAVGRRFNLGSGREVEIGRLAELIVRLTGSSAGIRNVAPRVWDLKPRALASVDRARDLLGYRPGSVSFDDGVERTVRWFRDNWEAIRRDADFGPAADREVE